MCFGDNFSTDSTECCVLQYLIVVVLLLLACYSVNKIFRYSGKRYGYFGKKGPLSWGSIFPDALGKRQSPINVISDEVCCMYPDSAPNSFPLNFQAYEKSPVQYTLCNDGVKAVLTGKWKPGETPFLTGGPLGCVKYYFSTLNFRWGPTDTWGSEHMLNFKRYPLELQMVHRTLPVSTPSEGECPTTTGDSVCVISYFFEIMQHENKYLNPIIHKLGKIQNVGSKVYLQPFPLTWLAPAFSYEFYTYPGSLTEPPCREVAIWLLKFYPTLCISKNQLECFRSLRSSEGPIIVNSRPVQNLNGRAVCFYSSD